MNNNIIEILKNRENYEYFNCSKSDVYLKLSKSKIQKTHIADNIFRKLKK